MAFNLDYNETEQSFQVNKIIRDKETTLITKSLVEFKKEFFNGDIERL